jgi:hypothetical protein
MVNGGAGGGDVSLTRSTAATWWRRHRSGADRAKKHGYQGKIALVVKFRYCSRSVHLGGGRWRRWTGGGRFFHREFAVMPKSKASEAIEQELAYMKMDMEGMNTRQEEIGGKVDTV